MKIVKHKQDMWSYINNAQSIIGFCKHFMSESLGLKIWISKRKGGGCLLSACLTLAPGLPRPQPINSALSFPTKAGLTSFMLQMPQAPPHLAELG